MLKYFKIPMFFLFISALILITSDSIETRVNARAEIKIPDIEGYYTLICDLHSHSVFSDGDVWPTFRVREAWMEGLDAIALTDHIEVFLPHKQDLGIDMNRSYNLATPSAEMLNILLIRGGEISRDMPPGHFNAIFINDVNLLVKEDFKESVQEAIKQGAFICWNHPGTGQPGGKPVWHPIHSELYENGMLHGIEIANRDEYYPEAFKWCIEKNLTILGNSDTHDPIDMEYDYARGGHRNYTLVFAKSKNVDSIKEALFDRRTAVYHKNYLMGAEKYLRQIFDKSIQINSPDVTLKDNQSSYVEVKNRSMINYELELINKIDELQVSQSPVFYGEKTTLLRIKNISKKPLDKRIDLKYKVKNLLTAPNTELVVTFAFNIHSQDK